MSELHDEIHDVLREAKHGKPNAKVRGVLTAYQILQLLPETRRNALVAKHGAPGKGAGTHYSAASAVAAAIQGMTDVDTDYLDTRHIAIAPGDTEAGDNNLCGIYLLMPTI